MRRILAIVLLVFLPLQFSWAAVATYCEHESSVDASHVGHHEHAHQGGTDADAASTGAADKVPGAPDLDCGHCHGLHAGMLWRAGELPIRPSNGHPDRPADDTVAVHSLARPERPQWASLA